RAGRVAAGRTRPARFRLAGLAPRAAVGAAALGGRGRPRTPPDGRETGGMAAARRTRPAGPGLRPLRGRGQLFRLVLPGGEGRGGRAPSTVLRRGRDGLRDGAEAAERAGGGGRLRGGLGPVRDG